VALSVLRESRFERVTVLENFGDAGVFRFEAVVSEMDYINQNRRMYPESVMWPAFETVNAVIERHPGTVDHPDPYGPVSVDDLGVAWESFRREGSLIIGVGRIIETARGKNLRAAMEAGVAVGFSTRGRGDGEEQQIAGRTVYVLSEYQLDTVDAVVDPSVGHARIRSFTKEERETMENELEQANEARQVAETRIAELETQLAEATSARETAEAALTSTNEAHAALLAERDARIAELETALESRQADALEAKLISLTSEHRFAATIIAQAKALGVTLETAENVVSVLSGVIEGVAASANEDIADQGAPRGDVSTEEDVETPVADKLTEAQLADLEGTGLI
jgi:hypothetical protein